MSKEEAAIPVTKNYDQFKVMLEEAEIDFEEFEEAIIVSGVSFRFDDDGSLLDVTRDE